jgi:DNA-binding response OmpR family regulator
MKILVADDEKDIADAIGIILKYNHFESNIVYDGAQAYEMAKQNIYDGMILDIMMPKLDGIQLLSRLRQEGDITPILLLTAKSEISDRIQGLNQGADDYLAKPFDKGELIARVQAMLRRHNSYETGCLQIGNTLLNLEALELTNGIHSLRLSSKEVEILTLFMHSEGKELSSAYLKEHLWNGAEYQNGIEALYIGYLKNKLQAIRSNMEIIKTPQGFLMKESEAAI